MRLSLTRQVDPVNSLIAYADVSTFSTSGNVFRTTNGGTTWTNITSNLASEPIWSLQIDGTTSPRFSQNNAAVSDV